MSRLFWVQEIEDERYELIFGDGVFGLHSRTKLFRSIIPCYNGSNSNGISDLNSMVS